MINKYFPISKANSLNGYSFFIWLSKNKADIKKFITYIFAILTFFVSIWTANINPTLSIAISGIVGILTKLLLDFIDFYFTEVEL